MGQQIISHNDYEDDVYGNIDINQDVSTFHSTTISRLCVKNSIHQINADKKNLRTSGFFIDSIRGFI